ncbi:MAG: hypothetical protein HC781_05875 [Leptolyngbyaceae cyanobacterium CSU_1_4]|nr:hypothetical protein [Leptolyngbyaceae cyanobacterium CSU_1_4]
MAFWAALFSTLGQFFRVSVHKPDLPGQTADFLKSTLRLCGFEWRSHSRYKHRSASVTDFPGLKLGRPRLRGDRWCSKPEDCSFKGDRCSSKPQAPKMESDRSG